MEVVTGAWVVVVFTVGIPVEVEVVGIVVVVLGSEVVVVGAWVVVTFTVGVPVEVEVVEIVEVVVGA